MAEQPATERAVHPVYPATAWGVDPLAFDGAVTLARQPSQQAASTYQRIWLVSATADLSLYPAQAAAVDTRAAPGRVHACRHAGLPRRAGDRRGAAVSRPRLGMSVAVGGLVAGAGAGHVLYPAWLAWRTRRAAGGGRVGRPGGIGTRRPTSPCWFRPIGRRA